jgi:predicted  nucleic acid-binding Zn-ribbon protein
MSFLAPLLEVQDLDRAADAARKRALEISERAAVPLVGKKIVEAETQLVAARGERAELETAEGELEQAVAQIAKDIEAAELERYSGKRKDRDAAVAHDASQQVLREKQESLEDQELELLESIEAVEARIDQRESALSLARAESVQIAEAIRKVETEVDGEVAGLGTSRAAITEKVPAPVLAAYEKVRAQPRSGGRGATSLTDGRCMGCRIQLPSLVKSRMLAEEEDALIQCPQCRKVLVR